MTKTIIKSRWTYLPAILLFIIGAASVAVPAAIARSLSAIITPLILIPVPSLPSGGIPVTFLLISLIVLIAGGILCLAEWGAKKNHTAKIVPGKLILLKKGKTSLELDAADIKAINTTCGFYDRITKTAKITIRARVHGKKGDRVKTFRLGRCTDAKRVLKALEKFSGITIPEAAAFTEKKQKKTRVAEKNSRRISEPEEDKPEPAKPAKRTVKAKKTEDTEKTKAPAAVKKTPAKTKTETDKTQKKQPRKKTEQKAPAADGFDYPDIRESRTKKTAEEKPLTITEEKAKAEYLKRTAGSEKGAEFEDELDTLLKKRDTIPAHHKTLKNLYIPYGDGTKRLSEIDNLVISETGIYVFECKNYSGTILGKKDAREWTVVYDNGEMKTFYSPILQNRGHIRSLSDLFGIPKDIFRSVIVFSGHTNLNGVQYAKEHTSVFCIDTLSKELRRITAAEKSVLSIKEVDEIYSWILPYTEASFEDRVKHLNHVEMLSKKEKV